ncbi:MAG: isoprenoid biosynthesis glyoxalase ElbB [Holophagales bacterium]|jgi:enhancing lycopene biosynthesis protein 2|nr:isoprenoid biosynthesis glyoxalase ElbB [Holophagales bacterium]
MTQTPKVAVLLAGCGHLDGAEIREAVLTLLALDQHGAAFQCIAPNANQHHVINHATGSIAEGQSRNILEESSRIARVGQCLDLAHARPDDFDALLIPGGFGVAKNHCTFAFDGPNASVRQDVADFTQAFFRAKKPVGAICISPAMVALILAKAGLCGKLTLGSGQGVKPAMDALKQKHVSVPDAREIVIDSDLKLVTTPAYMFDDVRLADVFVGIERCVAEVLRMV